jgi:hypothetical protein
MAPLRPRGRLLRAPISSLINRKQFRQNNRRDENGQEPGVDFRQHVQRKARGGEGPKQADAIGLAHVKDQMQEGAGETRQRGSEEQGPGL